MDELLIPTRPVRCIITGAGESGKSYVLTNLFLNTINEFEKIYIYSASLHHDLSQKLIECFTNYTSTHIIPYILNGKDIDEVSDEIVNKKDFQKSDTEKETYESIEELKYPQEYETGVLLTWMI